MLDLALNDLRILYKGGVSRTGWAGCIRKEDVQLWSKENALSIEETFDHISILLARAYSKGSLDWDFCDSAANNLFGVFIEFSSDSELIKSENFWKFYLAFDLSETVDMGKADEVARTEIADFLNGLPAAS